MKYFQITYMWNLKNQNKKKSEKKNKLLVARREEGGGIGERVEGEYSQK